MVKVIHGIEEPVNYTEANMIWDIRQDIIYSTENLPN